MTVQVPGAVDTSEPEEIEQPAVPALVTTYEYAPVPEPPDAVSTSGVPYVPLTEVSVTVAWAMRLNVTVVAEELATK